MMLFGSNNMQLEKFSEKLFSKVLHTEGFKIPYFFLSSGNFGSIHAHIAHQKRQEIVSLVKYKKQLFTFNQPMSVQGVSKKLL